MTAALPFSRSLPKHVLARSTRTFTRPSHSSSLLRVTCTCDANRDRPEHRTDSLGLASIYRRARTYATASAKPASRPKAHTGRTAAKRRTAAKEAAPAKSTKKPKKKAVKKPIPRVKKPLSKSALLKKERQATRELREAALLNNPKQLPQTAFTLIFTEETKKSGDARTKATSASEKYRSLSPEEREVREVQFIVVLNDLICFIAIQSPCKCQQRGERIGLQEVGGEPHTS